MVASIVQNGKTLRICANGTIGTINLSSNAALEIADGVSVTIGITLNVNSDRKHDRRHRCDGSRANQKLLTQRIPSPAEAPWTSRKSLARDNGSTIHNYCKIIVKSNSDLNSNALYNYSFCQVEESAPHQLGSGLNYS